MKKIVILLMIVLLCSAVFAKEAGLNKAQLIKNNLDKIDLSESPGVLRFILGKPKANVEVNGEVYGFKIAGNRVKDFVEGGIDNPHYIIRLSEETLDKIIASDDVMSAIEEAYLNGDIIVEPQRVGAKIKFWFLAKIMGWILPEEAEEPVKGDTDKDGLSDKFELEWGLDPKDPDENDNDVDDGFDDFDNDKFRNREEAMLNSDPKNPNDPDIDDMEEVKPGEVEEVPKDKHIYCKIKCCCDIWLEYQVLCYNVPNSKPWEDVKTGDYPYTPLSGAKGDSTVTGTAKPVVGPSDGLVYCEDHIEYEWEANGVDEQCTGSKFDFCQQNFKSLCTAYMAAAKGMANQAIEQCLKEGKQKCGMPENTAVRDASHSACMDC